MELFAAWSTLRDFFTAGGSVLVIIFILSIVMWTLILERYCFLRWVQPNRCRTVVKSWLCRDDKNSWIARRLREQLISQEAVSIRATLPFIKSLVAVCPLCGLLGTVTGMISVFETMSFSGLANPRLMAGGISMATIPTMAGMVASLSGLFFSSQLDIQALKAEEIFAEQLVFKDRGQ